MSTSPPPPPPPPGPSKVGTTFPQGIVVSSSVPRVISKLWWLTAISLVVAIALVVGAQRRSGPRITIHFADGHGLKAGDILRYRGISVGEVTDVALRPKLSGVAVTVVLETQAGVLARAGSEFWVERPRVSLSRVSGLETVVGAKYLGVRPGPVDAPRVDVFEGIDSPPTIIDGEYSEITIRFKDGHGLQAGDPVRYRGIVIGEVNAVDLDKDLSGVAVRVRLTGMGRQVAREGSQFWVERPRLAMAEVRGLDTLVGGRYMTVSPGPDDASPLETFTGLESAPVAAVPTGGLEIILHSPQRWGVDRGVPVTYRGLTVGQVTSIGLSSDASLFEARAVIEPRYRTLVRTNSVFWSTSGFDVNVGLSGVQLNADTLATIAQGGIAFATPEVLGEPANSGQRFHFARTDSQDWTRWKSHINLTEGLPAGSGKLPEPQRAVAKWVEKGLAFNRRLERSGLVIVTDNQRLLGPADLLLPSEHPVGEVTLEMAGLRLVIDPKQVERFGAIARATLPSTPEGIAVWPKDQIRKATEPEDVLVVFDTQAAPHPLTASSLKQQNGEWEPDTSSGLNLVWHGAPVLSTKDGKLIGLLVFRKNRPWIVTVDVP